MKAAQALWRSSWFIHVPVNCFLHNVFNLCYAVGFTNCCLVTPSLGSLSIMKETKPSSVYKLKFAEVLGKVAIAREALPGSLNLPTV